MKWAKHHFIIAGLIVVAVLYVFKIWPFNPSGSISTPTQ